MKGNLKILNKESNCVLRAVLQVAETQDPDAVGFAANNEEIVKKTRENLRAVGTSPERIEELLSFEVYFELIFLDRAGLEEALKEANRLFDEIPLEESATIH